ncbi:MAG: hypothetical protein AAF667_07455 [Pseudomonadota bacterium]
MIWNFFLNFVIATGGIAAGYAGLRARNEDDDEEVVSEPEAALVDKAKPDRAALVPDLDTDDEPEPDDDPAPPQPEPEEPETIVVGGGGTPAPDPEPDPNPGGSGGSDDPDHGTTVDINDDITVSAGRVTTLSVDEDGVTSVRTLSDPADGNVTVNPDNTIALVLTKSDYTGAASFDYEVTYGDGSTETKTANLNVTPGAQEAGWGEGNFYTLEEGDDGRYVIESGENHRKVYVSGDEEALSLADIAALEGLTANEITADWLVSNPEYGGYEDMALAEDAAGRLWGGLNSQYDSVEGSYIPHSSWMLLERGYEYPDIGNLMNVGSIGESELNPILIGAWGEGDAPVIGNSDAFIRFKGNFTNQNIVFQDVVIESRIVALEVQDVIFDHVTFSGEAGSTFQVGSNVTFHETAFLDVYRSEPVIDGRSTWWQSENRVAGTFIDHVDGLLVDGVLVDQVGWGVGYDYNRSVDDPQPPSYYSHGLYFDAANTDVTLRDSVFTQAASYGTLIRSGAVIEDNVYAENNGALVIVGGNHAGAGHVSNYSLVLGNVVTSGAHKTVDKQQGILTEGIHDVALQTTYIDNIITHLANPNDPDEIAERTVLHFAHYQQHDPYYDDTIIYNWDVPSQAGYEQNVDGLNTDLLDQTTLQNFAADLLDDPNASIDDLTDYLRGQMDGSISDDVDADEILAYFRQAFGIDAPSPASDHTFVPDDRADGVRWDNRLNWDTDVVPQDGDDVDLNGNWVNYSGTTEINDLDLGSGGQLQVWQGKLEVSGALEAGESGGLIDVDVAGQLWTDGYDDQDLMDIDVSGGRFANTGVFSGNADLSVSEDGQAILATENARFEQGAGNTIGVTGNGARVGFDGANGGIAVLDLNDSGTLGFETDGDGDLGHIGEFKSGAYGDAPNVQSGVDLGDATLEVDVADFDGSSHLLVEVDALAGTFGDIVVTGLGGRDARIVVDYDTDTVSMELINGGSGSTMLEVIGDAGGSDENADLWAALTSGNSVAEDEDPAPSADDDQVALTV